MSAKISDETQFSFAGHNNVRLSAPKINKILTKA